MSPVGSSHEPWHHTESGRQLIHRMSESRKRSSLPTHIFFRKVLFIAAHDSWPLTLGMLGYANTRRKGGLEVIEPNGVKDVYDFIASVVVDGTLMLR